MLATPNLLKTSQVARRLDLSTTRIRQLAEAGRLACVSTPYGRLFAEDTVDAFARERVQEQKPGVGNAHRGESGTTNGAMQ